MVGCGPDLCRYDIQQIIHPALFHLFEDNAVPYANYFGVDFAGTVITTAAGTVHEAFGTAGDRAHAIVMMDDTGAAAGTGCSSLRPAVCLVITGADGAKGE